MPDFLSVVFIVCDFAIAQFGLQGDFFFGPLHEAAFTCVCEKRKWSVRFTSRLNSYLTHHLSYVAPPYKLYWNSLYFVGEMWVPFTDEFKDMLYGLYGKKKYFSELSKPITDSSKTIKNLLKSLFMEYESKNLIGCNPQHPSTCQEVTDKIYFECLSTIKNYAGGNATDDVFRATIAVITLAMYITNKQAKMLLVSPYITFKMILYRLIPFIKVLHVEHSVTENGGTIATIIPAHFMKEYVKGVYRQDVEFLGMMHNVQ